MTTLSVSAPALRALRMERQGLLSPAADAGAYEALFRRMQPVRPVAFSCPGEPPALVYRCEEGGRCFAEPWRAQRRLVKGRFQGGRVGYILADDWETMIAAYRRPADLGDPCLRHFYEFFRREAPLTIHQMQEATGWKAKEITALLHTLQQAFLVYEDQVDGDWERGWYLFESEFPQVTPGAVSREEALETLVLRQMESLGFADLETLRGFYCLPGRELKAAAGRLADRGLALPASLEGRDGWMRPQDAALLPAYAERPGPPSVFVLPLSDYLVLCAQAALKRRFALPDVLQYLLVDGEFAGAVRGKWRQGPHDLWEIALFLPAGEAARRREEIRAAVRAVYPHLDEMDCPLRAYGVGGGRPETL
ncbi:MAG TPA: winged helix DNA-binding domain-containing protein [Firmicutes bacterium]|nr:winged helix DNA-binding domain-containing protein [Bacillota bacterium]